MSSQQALEVQSLRSICQQTDVTGNWQRRPFRQPHHTSSAVALAGGGTQPQPGEISLAHNGVLFLDELPEFAPKALEVMRQPLESGQVFISRAARKVTYPARFQLIAAMNPSPTGDVHDGRCTSEQVLKYLNRISGPLLDRIDLQVQVQRLEQFDAGYPDQPGESSHTIRQRVEQACHRQSRRQATHNANLSGERLLEVCQLDKADQAFVRQAIAALGLSMRAYHRTLKVARTIADLAQCDRVERAHLAEALSYRALDTIINSLALNH